MIAAARDPFATGIAVAALLVSVVSFRLSGPRLKLSLGACVYTNRGLRTYGPRWPKNAPTVTDPTASDFWIEVAEIEVKNVGRSVGWVSNLGLDFGRESLRRRRRCQMSLRPLAVHGGLADAASVRLEPGQFVTMYVPMVEAVEWACCDTGRERVRLRASASIGRGRTRRSAFRKAWRLTAQEARFPHLEPTRSTLIFRQILGAWPTSDVSGLYDACINAMVALDYPDRGSVREALEPSLGPMASVAVSMQLEALGPRPRQADVVDPSSA